jgi:Fe-S cluster biosynthesis and repair protein YggX
MNEYKIQLESREDLTYLRDEMNKFLNENCEENCGKHVIKQQVNRK